ncbi:MAG: ABC transporter permease [Thermoprotei archaeon]|jgi:peptide/nickel transport system permease protein
MAKTKVITVMSRKVGIFSNALNIIQNIINDKYGFIGLLILAIITGLGVIAPYLPIPDYNSIEFPRLMPPSEQHIFGTDYLGRDILSRTIWGARISLSVGIVAAGIASMIGIILGTIAGYYSGFLDNIISRFTDIFLVIPGFFLALTIVAIYGSNLYLIMIIIGLTTWPATARIMRAQVMQVKEFLYVEAVKALGASNTRILIKHIIPGAIQPAIANTILQIGNAIIIEAGLSYLGLGDPNFPSWGRIIYEGQPYIASAWWSTLFPGIFLVLTVLGLSFIGDSLNRILTPKIKQISTKI